MKQKTAIKQLWSRTFNDSKEYVDWFFDNVYTDANGMLLTKDNRPVSALLLQQYSMQFHDADITVGYICGACTAKRSRGKGYMSRVMNEAIRNSYKRGDTLCALIPADDSLYNFYSRFGFATSFFANIERYSPLDYFPFDGGKYSAVDTPDIDALYRFTDGMMQRRHCSIQHTASDFANILEDLRLDGGMPIAIADRHGAICACAFTVPHDNHVKVTDILYSDSGAKNAVLSHIVSLYAGLPIHVCDYPSEEHPEYLSRRGMVRIINVHRCLSTLAARYPDIKLKIRISDHLIVENAHTFVITDGECFIDDSVETVDYDVKTEVLAYLICGNGTPSNALGFPVRHLFMSLMLD